MGNSPKGQDQEPLLFLEDAKIREVNVFDCLELIREESQKRSPPHGPNHEMPGFVRPAPERTTRFNSLGAAKTLTARSETDGSGQCGRHHRISTTQEAADIDANGHGK